MANQNLSEELLQLRKRARRRLIGAIALVIFALCVLWTALDSQPPASMVSSQPVEVISSAPALAAPVAAVPAASETLAAENANADVVIASAGASLASEALPGRLVNVQQPPAETAAEEVEPVAPAVAPTPKAKPTPRPTVKPTSRPVVKPTTDPQRILDGLDDPSSPTPKPAARAERYFIQVGAYSDAAKAAAIVARMKGAGLPASSDTVETREKGTLTRVRLGPTSNEALAREWLAKLQALGLDGRIVTK
ncbi:SPOR domain-containing protein [Chitinilyticum litopenaei]|uniref:SPOR domain-containing protein n=1 Tax=Chitinilyticum litopenaei TaxID=1121276 RepID=UPI0004244224|nr:SPOR domain-containing protein [Chitinilyticum litopenaei]